MPITTRASGLAVAAGLILASVSLARAESGPAHCLQWTSTSPDWDAEVPADFDVSAAASTACGIAIEWALLEERSTGLSVRLEGPGPWTWPMRGLGGCHLFQITAGSPFEVISTAIKVRTPGCTPTAGAEAGSDL